MTLSPHITLNDGNTIPRLGLGVWRLADAEAPKLIAEAIDAGYRHIDTAQAYQNEGGVGQGLKNTKVRRRDIWVTSKLQTSLQGYDSTLRAFDQTMSKLGLDQLDLFLVHWPAPARDQYVATWKAFIELQQQGRIRSIGVSNFLPEHLERIIGETGVTPAVNQIELHPSFQQGASRDWHNQHGIVTESYSPLGGKGTALLENPVIAGIARRLGKSPAQVIIRWHLQLDLVVLPKSSKLERAVENFNVWDFDLTENDMSAIAGLDRPDGKTLPHPNELND
ncbi:aldo/keto reductase (plasmid) [Devosia neptuniae]|uniref:Aldo/keto reductase n=1 Tax=Devosia neptuniae TaxID=191302 RepID=A0ABY6C820_9HYPH|nr:aldo/keto reductase [Devosia neptuniae]UXN68018.1 aldo/keto reductase [Devosia neptuniae]